VGYIEAKDVGAHLSDVSDSEQLKRYRAALPNLILTDYLEFHWYVNGDERLIARLAHVDKSGRVTVDRHGEEEVQRVLEHFLNNEPEPIRTPQALAVRMARITHLIRDSIVASYAQDMASNLLRGWREAFSKVLISDLDQPHRTADFADMFAQTLTYGLFSARVTTTAEVFTRQSAQRLIPRTNPFLRSFFAAISGIELDDEPYSVFVDDMVSMFQVSDIDAILTDFGKHTKQTDPIIHFYETFLKAYDNNIRELRGVYFTPEPIVSYIVRSVDNLLRERFGCVDGLADTTTVSVTNVDPSLRVKGQSSEMRKTTSSHKVLVLDPASGTATFLYAVVELIRERFMARGNAGLWSGYVRDHLLPRLFGFELLVAPYAVAHFKLGLQLAGRTLPAEQRHDWAYDFTSDERLGIYLTNSLEAPHEYTGLPLLTQWVADETDAANQVKQNLPVLVIMGNPPYSPSQFEGPWIMSLLDNYRTGLRERKSNVNREEWKFLAFAQWRIERSGSGIIAFVINNTFIDGGTLRLLRRSLLETFDDIYVLDLHGSVMRSRSAPQAANDANVFDIEQGVAILILSRNLAPKKAANGSRQASVHYAELWGSRDSKYDWLLEHDWSDTPWQDVQPDTEYFRFLPRDTDIEAEYASGVEVASIFQKYSSGIQTKQDRLAIQPRRDLVMPMLQRLINLSPDEARRTFNLGEDSSGWNVVSAQNDIRQTGIKEELVVPILYRPFDRRWTYYTKKSGGFLGRPRREIMQHMIAGENVGLITMRQTVGGDYSYVGVTDIPCCHGTFYLGNRGQDYLFPLWTYMSGEGQLEAAELEVGWAAGRNGRRPNIARAVVHDIEAKLGMTFTSDGGGDLATTFGPEDLLAYVYGVLHIPSYRSRYAEFLKNGFPRVPLTSKRVLFKELVEVGYELLSAHLLKSPNLHELVQEMHFPRPGSNRVAPGYPRYVAPGEVEPLGRDLVEQGRVYINGNAGGQYFEGVGAQVWEFLMGGYQVCEKWLKDRRGQELSYDDQVCYQQIVATIGETIRLMNKAEVFVSSWPLT
jgi:hypothetical protein